MDDRIFKFCLQQNSIFENFENPRIFYKIRDIFDFVFNCIQKRKCLQIKWKVVAKRPKSRFFLN